MQDYVSFFIINSLNPEAEFSFNCLSVISAPVNSFSSVEKN